VIATGPMEPSRRRPTEARCAAAERPDHWVMAGHSLASDRATATGRGIIG
jgi:hypothetical protein